MSRNHLLGRKHSMITGHTETASRSEEIRRCCDFYLNERIEAIDKVEFENRLAGGKDKAPPRFELGNKGFADLCLTTWLWRRKKKSGKRDSNSRQPPWQGGALPTELFPLIEPQYKFDF